MNRDKQRACTSIRIRIPSLQNSSCCLSGQDRLCAKPSML